MGYTLRNVKPSQYTIQVYCFNTDRFLFDLKSKWYLIVNAIKKSKESKTKEIKMYPYLHLN